MTEKKLNEYKQSLLAEIPTFEVKIKAIDELINAHFEDPNNTELSNKYWHYIPEEGGKELLACWWRDIYESEIIKRKREALPTEEKYFNKYLYSDVHAYKCVKEFTPNKVGVVRLQTKHVGEAYTQNWEFTMPEYKDEDIIILRKHKNGKWYEANTNCCPFMCSDTPHEYYDWEF